MGAIKYFYIGFCVNKGCPRKDETVKFPVPYEKVESYEHMPPTCSVCGKWLFGDVVETEEEQNYRLR